MRGERTREREGERGKEEKRERRKEGKRERRRVSRSRVQKETPTSESGVFAFLRCGQVTSSCSPVS
jgi:hypothetical protein